MRCDCQLQVSTFALVLKEGPYVHCSGDLTWASSGIHATKLRTWHSGASMQFLSCSRHFVGDGHVSGWLVASTALQNVNHWGEDG